MRRRSKGQFARHSLNVARTKCIASRLWRREQVRSVSKIPGSDVSGCSKSQEEAEVKETLRLSVGRRTADSKAPQLRVWGLGQGGVGVWFVVEWAAAAWWVACGRGDCYRQCYKC